MLSSWEETKKRSNYHFDNFKMDPQVDKVTILGKIVSDFSQDVKEIISKAKPATWRTRGSIGKARPEEEFASEEYDLEKFGYGKDYIITHLNWELTPKLKRVSNLFGIENCMERIHVQMPGEVWNLHIDKLEKWATEMPSSVVRIFIHLTDWEQGHFWSYGNFVHTQWRSGDVATFDWQNLPHSTANAGHNPRVTLQLTGVVTDTTTEFINRLKRFGTYQLD